MTTARCCAQRVTPTTSHASLACGESKGRHLFPVPPAATENISIDKKPGGTKTRPKNRKLQTHPGTSRREL
ncbi:hypothetical protein ILYODFUR_026032 [Ilyodon furcidens]|uniref:Secreted protein n=1 Tax=Ilyodon furcidens TaxID=33524 RepID=A0ABV0TYB6_9TELE